ncbi:MAG: metal-dependent hydrolase [Planctomycetaceae bacterium]|nr:metal-dependent hydrolase [Planctomycetaceae bacterium]
MYGQTHAGLGWAIGMLPPTSDRRLRAWCTIAAVVPDYDAGAMLFGMDAYVRLHHKPGHNVYFGLLFLLAAYPFFHGRPLKQRWTAIVLISLALASHLLTDMKLSGWEVYLFWPFSERGYGFQPILALGHPINLWLAGVFMTLPWLLALWKPVTPLELVSPRLDRIFLNAFRKKSLACSTCGTSCNNRCDTCERPACMKHGRLDWKFRIACPACASP